MIAIPNQKRPVQVWAPIPASSVAVTKIPEPGSPTVARRPCRPMSSEERELASLPSMNLLMPHLKAETKHVLVEDGHLP